MAGRWWGASWGPWWSSGARGSGDAWTAEESQAGLTAEASQAGLTAEEQGTAYDARRLRRPTGVPWPKAEGYPAGYLGRGGKGSQYGWAAEEKDKHEELPQSARWTFRVYADLERIPGEWWAALSQRLLGSFDVAVSRRKERHADNRMWVPYRLSVRGVGVFAGAEEVLDSLCTDHPDVIEPWDIEPIPCFGEELESQEQRSSRLEGWVAKFGDERSSEENLLRGAFLRTKVRWSWRDPGEQVVAASRETIKALRKEVCRRKEAGSDRRRPEELQAETREEQEEEQVKEEPVVEAEEVEEEVVEAGFDRHAEVPGVSEEARRAEYEAAYLQEEKVLLSSLVGSCRQLLPSFGAYFAEKFQHFDRDSDIGGPYDFHVCFCVVTFKRTYQLEKAIELNVATTWRFRKYITWMIADFNEGERVLEVLGDKVPFSIVRRHVRLFRARQAWRYFDCAVAKNTSHLTTQALTGKYREDQIYVVNVDNDNIVTQEFCLDVLAVAQEELAADLERPGARVGTQWSSKDMGTFGRIGLPLATFRRMGGYDEGMKGIGAQDTDLTWRLQLLGRFVSKNVPWVGLTVPNRESEVDRGMALDCKARRKGWDQEADEKMRNLQPELVAQYKCSFRALSKANGQRMKRLNKEKRWKRNAELQSLGVEVGESVLLQVMLDTWGLTEAGLDRQGQEEERRRADEERAREGEQRKREEEERRRLAEDMLQRQDVERRRKEEEEQRGRLEEERRRREEAEVKRRRAGTRVCSIVAVSFGTRTLKHSYHGNPSARRMHDSMWSRGDREARRALDAELAESALRGCGSLFDDCGEIFFVDCTKVSGFSGEPGFDRQGHVGMHERIQAACVGHPRFTGIAARLQEIQEWMRRSTSEKCAVAFWCNAGEHRSVACCELFARWWRKKYLSPVPTAHLCRNQWGRRGCGGCQACHHWSPAIVGTDEEFARLLG